MLSSIHPLGERARHNRWWLTVTSYLAASVVGGAVVGAAAGALGWALLGAWSVPVGARLVAAAVVGVAAAGWDTLARSSLPPRRQVDEDWLAAYRGWVYGAGFGLQLGAGLTTVITTALVPAAFALAVLAATPAAGALIGAAFGVARGAPILLMRPVVSAPALRAFHTRLQARHGPARVLGAGAGAGLAVVAAALVVSAAAPL